MHRFNYHLCYKKYVYNIYPNFIGKYNRITGNLILIFNCVELFFYIVLIYLRILKPDKKIKKNNTINKKSIQILNLNLKNVTLWFLKMVIQIES